MSNSLLVTIKSAYSKGVIRIYPPTTPYEPCYERARAHDTRACKLHFSNHTCAHMSTAREIAYSIKITAISSSASSVSSLFLSLLTTSSSSSSSTASP